MPLLTPRLSKDGSRFLADIVGSPDWLARDQCEKPVRQDRISRYGRDKEIRRERQGPPLTVAGNPDGYIAQWRQIYPDAASDVGCGILPVGGIVRNWGRLIHFRGRPAPQPAQYFAAESKLCAHSSPPCEDRRALDHRNRPASGCRQEVAVFELDKLQFQHQFQARKDQPPSAGVCVWDCQCDLCSCGVVRSHVPLVSIQLPEKDSLYLCGPDYPALRETDDPAKSELMHWFEGRPVIESWVPIVAHYWVILNAQRHTVSRNRL